MRPYLFLLATLLPAHAALYRGDMGGHTLVASDDALAYYDEAERLPQPLTPSPACDDGAACYRSAHGDTLRLRDGNAWWNDTALAPYPAPVTAPENRLYATELPFAAALLADVSFQKTATTTVHGKTLQWYRDPDSGLEHPLIASGYPDAERDALNQYLRAQALNTLAARRECLAALPADKRAALQYRVTITPTLLDDHYASFHLHEENSCGAPYAADSGISYSLAAGRGLELEDLLWLGDSPPHPLDDDNPADQMARERRAQWLLDTLKRLAPEAMRDYPYQPRHYLYPYFYLTPQGAYIGPLLPARAAVHAHPAGTVIPWEQLQVHPGSGGNSALP